MFYVIELYQESQSLMPLQIAKCRLPSHGEALAERLYACGKIWNLVLAHKQHYSIFLCKNNNYFSLHQILALVSLLAIYFPPSIPCMH
jgi:hypothetical protein